MTTALSIVSHLSSQKPRRGAASADLAPTLLARSAGDVTQQLFQQVPYPIAFLAGDFSLCRANPAFCRLTGVSAPELSSNSLGDMFQFLGSSGEAPKTGDLVICRHRPETCWKLRIIALNQGTPFLPATAAVIFERAERSPHGPGQDLDKESLQKENENLQRKAALLSAKLAMLEAALAVRTASDDQKSA